jgi:hypothetical protein
MPVQGWARRLAREIARLLALPRIEKGIDPGEALRSALRH